jgi:ABC-type multidrug transport system fused ATPase/permease subunit
LTYDLRPTDLDNIFTWSRVALLSFAAVFIPLFRPRTYTPADPRHPAEPDQIHPEQVTPWISLALYSFLDSLVLKAWRVPALPFEALHPLADYDRAIFLYKQHRLKIDPVRRQQAGLKPRHVFPGLLLSNVRAVATICLFCVISAASELSGSVGIQKVLEYLETDGEGKTFKPILWVALLFVGPTIGSLAIQGYVYLNTRLLVRSEAILTQLLFDHALRLRMKDSTDDQTDGTKVPQINVENVEDDSSETEAGSSTGSKMKKDKAARADEEASKSNGQGLAGKINVLISSDVESILGAF